MAPGTASSTAITTAAFVFVVMSGLPCQRPILPAYKIVAGGASLR
jgi:hypothetical protein